MGNNANLPFYAWRLQQSNLCTVSVVTGLLDASQAIRIETPLLNSPAKFVPDYFAPSVGHLPSKSVYDYVILSVANLQEFQDTCTQIAPHVDSHTLVIVESTGYVNLEPFVLLSHEKFKDATVCLIMNESDVKRVPDSNTFVHRILSDNHRIYLGVCTAASAARVKSLDGFGRLYKILQNPVAGQKSQISLLKSTNVREFMTYQWKLALPRLVLNPLTIIFEEPYVENLATQILAKPLISGLVNEIFKIIKKMDCKLVKGYETEANILKMWLTLYPYDSDGALRGFIDANSLFYDFYNLQPLEIDLLLLQPILLGDDNGVRAPYLENLYLTICQLSKYNSGASMMFTRKIAGRDSKMNELNLLTEDLARMKIDKQAADHQHRELVVLLKLAESELSQKNRTLEVAAKEHNDMLAKKAQVSKDLQAAESAHLQRLEEMERQISQKRNELQHISLSIQNAQAEQQKVSETQNTSHQSRSTSNSHAIAEVATAAGMKNATVAQTPDLSDFADVAMYGAMLNGEDQPKQPPHLQTQPSITNGLTEPGAPSAQRYDSSEGETSRKASGNLDGYANAAYGPSYNNNVNNGYNPNNGYYDPASGPNGPLPNGHMNGSGPSQTNQNYAYSGPNDQGYNGPNQNYNGQNYGPGGPNFGPNGQNYGPNGYAQNPSGPNNYNGYSNYNQGYNQGYPGGQNHYNQGGYQPNHSLTGPKTYMPMNGPGGTNGANNHNRQLRYQPHDQYGAPRQKMSSGAGIPGQPQQYMQQQFHPGSQMPAMQPSSSQGFTGSQIPSSKSKQNRRSAFALQALNIDYGGRGGMPMPGTGSAPKQRAKSMLPSMTPPSPAQQPQLKSNSSGQLYHSDQRLRPLAGMHDGGHSLGSSNDHVVAGEISIEVPVINGSRDEMRRP